MNIKFFITQVVKFCKKPFNAVNIIFGKFTIVSNYLIFFIPFQ